MKPEVVCVEWNRRWNVKRLNHWGIVWFTALCLIGCGANTLDSEINSGKADQPWENQQDRFLDDDANLVLRQRLDVVTPEDHFVEVTETFSHRSRKWHVYPFTLFGGSRFKAELKVLDRLMFDRASIQLFGPRKDNGKWPAPREVLTAMKDGQPGVAVVEGTATEYGEYALVVGPRQPDLFMPRFPGHGALVAQVDPATSKIMTDEDGFDLTGDADIELHPEGGAYLLLASGERFEILNPRLDTGTSTLQEGSTELEVLDGHGPGPDDDEVKKFWVLSWRIGKLLLPEDATGPHDWRNVLIKEDDIESLLVYNIDTGDYDDFTILDAIGADGTPSVDPVIYRVAPSWDEQGRGIAPYKEDPDCEVGFCHLPAYIDSMGHGNAVELVPEDQVTHFKTTYLDMDEVSRYHLTLSCSGVCTPSARPTRYPIYFAHGFNSSAKVWQSFLSHLRKLDTAWDGWIDAQDVPGYDPVEIRAEALRRNLTALLRRTPSLDSEPNKKVNVIAHSMGGLDTRYLIGHPKYNSDACASDQECQDAAGNPEACCMRGPDNQAVFWRHRIASLTTLSTPHRGSSFADWGIKKLAGKIIRGLFNVALKIFGFGQDNMKGFELCMGSLSNDWTKQVMEVEPFTVPIKQRVFRWSCATGKEPCAGGGAKDESKGDDDSDKKGKGDDDSDKKGKGDDEDPNTLAMNAEGQHLLPGPEELPTIFSWAGRSCITGKCGDLLPLSLILPYKVVKDDEGANDGVVAIDSAVYGIYMGVRNVDHLDWTSFEASRKRGFFKRLFGVKQGVHALDWLTHWVDQLAKANY